MKPDLFDRTMAEAETAFRKWRSGPSNGPIDTAVERLVEIGFLTGYLQKASDDGWKRRKSWWRR